MRLLLALVAIAVVALALLLFVLRTDGKDPASSIELPEPGVARAEDAASELDAGGGVEPPSSREALPSTTIGKGLVLEGIVRDDQGAAISDFDVVAGEELLLPSVAPRLELLRRASDGTFLLPGFQEGPWTVRVSARGHAPAQRTLTFPVVEKQTFTLPRLAIVSGVVVDETGSPLQRAKLFLRSGRYGRYDVVAETDGEGRYSFTAPPTLVQVFVSAAGHLPADPLELDLAPGESHADLVWRLDSGGAIDGLVHALGGEQARRRVRVQGARFGEDYTTDRDGRFRATGLPAGSYDVLAYPTKGEVRAFLGEYDENGELLLRRSRTVAVVEGETASILFEAAEIQPVDVTGVVTLDGRTLLDCGMAARRDGVELFAEADVEGRCRMQLLPGTWQVEFDLWTDGGDIDLAFEEEVPVGPEHRIETRLQTGSISGTVHTLGGDPVADAWIAAETQVDDRRITTAVRTDALGAYRLASLPTGSYTLRTEELAAHDRTRQPTLVSEAREDVFVNAGVETTHVDFALGPGGGVRIYSRADEAENIATRLHLLGTSDAIEVSYAPRERCFVAIGIAPGLYDVTIAGGPLTLTGAHSIDVVAGAFAEVGLELAVDD